jgi:ABC-type transport system involved in cytochrome bd biosynthesis fused ATPase/permease subunit
MVDGHEVRTYNRTCFWFSLSVLSNEFFNVKVHELSPRWLSRHISIVSQEPTLFARSVKRNIMYGLEGTDMEPTQEEIERACKLANADVFIEVGWSLESRFQFERYALMV